MKEGKGERGKWKSGEEVEWRKEKRETKESGIEEGKERMKGAKRECN